MDAAQPILVPGHQLRKLARQAILAEIGRRGLTGVSFARESMRQRRETLAAVGRLTPAPRLGSSLWNSVAIGGLVICAASFLTPWIRVPILSVSFSGVFLFSLLWDAQAILRLLSPVIGGEWAELGRYVGILLLFFLFLVAEPAWSLVHKNLVRRLRALSSVVLLVLLTEGLFFLMGPARDFLAVGPTVFRLGAWASLVGAIAMHFEEHDATLLRAYATRGDAPNE